MTQVVLTSRPITINPISWINAITRIKTRSPFDHVTLLIDGVIYESAAGTGVHSISLDKWSKGRESTYLFLYDVPNTTVVNFDSFRYAEGRGYDYKANLLFLFGRVKKLKKKSTRRYFCSELVAEMLNLAEPYHFAPDNLESWMRHKGWELNIAVL